MYVELTQRVQFDAFLSFHSGVRHIYIPFAGEHSLYIYIYETSLYIYRFADKFCINHIYIPFTGELGLYLYMTHLCVSFC